MDFFKDQQYHHQTKYRCFIRLLFLLATVVFWLSPVTFRKTTLTITPVSKHQLRNKSYNSRNNSYNLANRRLETNNFSANSVTSKENKTVLKRKEKKLIWDNLLDVDEVSKYNNGNNIHVAVPFFWHIHKTGGTTMKNLFSQCLAVTVASQRAHQLYEAYGVLPKNLEKVKIGKGTFLNADVSSIEGIEMAHKSLNFAHQAPLLLEQDDSLAIMTSQIRKATELLFISGKNNSFRGILFALFRHPVEREISAYYYLQKATWEKSYDPSFANLSVQKFVEMNGHGNWMVKHLVGKTVVGEQDLINAKWILKHKCWIGLQNQYYESVLRFGHVFGWDKKGHNNYGRWKSCTTELEKGNHVRNSNNHDTFDEKSKEWRFLSRVNNLDMELYSYALELFQEQGDKYFSTL